MPSIFSKSRQPTPAISRPVPCRLPSMHDFPGETSWVHTPSMPPPPPPPAPMVPRLPRGRSTTATQIIDLYDPTGYSPDLQFLTHGQGNSMSSSYSSSQYDDDNFLTSTSPRSVSLTRSQVQSRRPPPPPPPPSSQPPVQRNDALGRGLSHRYAPSNMTHHRLMSVVVAGHSRPSTVRTRTDTRMQGRWLKLGTVRLDPRELKRQEKEVEKMRRKNQKEMKKVEREVARQAAKADGMTVKEI